MGDLNLTQRLDRLEAKMDTIIEKLGDKSEDFNCRITKLETSQKGLLAFVSTIFSLTVAYIASKFNIKV